MRRAMRYAAAALVRLAVTPEGPVAISDRALWKPRAAPLLLLRKGPTRMTSADSSL